MKEVNVKTTYCARQISTSALSSRRTRTYTHHESTPQHRIRISNTSTIYGQSTISKIEVAKGEIRDDYF